jgi:hypothetical protein
METIGENQENAKNWLTTIIKHFLKPNIIFSFIPGENPNFLNDMIDHFQVPYKKCVKSGKGLAINAVLAFHFMVCYMIAKKVGKTSKFQS